MNKIFLLLFVVFIGCEKRTFADNILLNKIKNPQKKFRGFIFKMHQ